MTADPPVTLKQLPGLLKDLTGRMAAVEDELQFLKNLLALSRFGVHLPERAERDPRLHRPSPRLRLGRPPRRSRQGGHL